MGFHKTASSSFQDTCLKNRHVLKQQHILFPEFHNTLSGKRTIANQSGIFLKCFGNSYKKYSGNIKREKIDVLRNDYMVQFEKILSLDTNIIFSGEAISLLSPMGLEQVKNMIKKYDKEIVPIAVVRSPYEYHCSMLQQKIRSGDYLEFLQFISQVNKITTIQKVFPQTHFFPFKKICCHSYGPVGFLLEYMGISCKNIAFVQINDSRTNAFIRLQNTLNKEEASRKNGRANPKFQKLENINEHFSTKFLLTEGEYSALEDVLAQENAFFNEHLGEDFMDKNMQFCDLEKTFHEIALYLAQMQKNNSGHKSVLRRLAAFFRGKKK